MERDIEIWVEEIAMDGAISMGNSCRKTTYNWVKAMNKYLEDNKYEWRVNANYKKNLIEIAKE